MSSVLHGVSLLVTGGSGSFGHAFARHALDAGARRVVIYSRDELKQAEMRAAFSNDARLRFFLGDVRDVHRLELAMHGCDMVVHAAAMKRIEQCESDPTEAVATNVQGTINVARAAIRAHLHRAVFLSTDKAPIPCTLYGMTKAVAERSWIRSNAFVGDGPTRLNAVRYGNVAGSRGSVLSLFRAQRDRGVPLTLTSEAMTRFWMRLDQAVATVVYALGLETGGSIVVPKIPHASLLDFARAVVGPDLYLPGHVVTGLRPGERLHETLIAEHEAPFTGDYGAYYQIQPEQPTWGFAPTLENPVPSGFTYRSDDIHGTATVDELRAMLPTERAA